MVMMRSQATTLAISSMATKAMTPWEVMAATTSSLEAKVKTWYLATVVTICCLATKVTTAWLEVTAKIPS